MSDGVVSAAGFMMWNCEPDEPAELWWWWREDREESTVSTLEKGSRSRLASAGGGVRARLSGDAWKDWN